MASEWDRQYWVSHGIDAQVVKAQAQRNANVGEKVIIHFHSSSIACQGQHHEEVKSDERA